MALYNMPDGCIWPSDVDFYEWLGYHKEDESEPNGDEEWRLETEED